MRIYWLVAALLLSALLAGLNLWAVDNHMYWNWLWLDIPMHYLGGVATSALVVALMPGPKVRMFALTMAGIFIGWEIFEYVYKVPQQASDYVLDTLKDLTMDTIGALGIYTLASKTLWKTK